METIKKILLGLFVVLSLPMTAQNLNKFERQADDNFHLHCCIHSLETSDGNIVLMEECFNIVNEAETENQGVNLVKISPEGEMLSVKFVEFKAIQYDNPFIKNPQADNSNIMAGFYFNEEDGAYYYQAVFFDDDLNVIKNVNTAVEAEGFDEFAELLYDKNSNTIIMAYESKSEENTCVYAKMDLEGKILDISYSTEAGYAHTWHYDSPLFVYDTDPLRYGYVRNSSVSGDNEGFIVILDENMEVVEMKTMGIAFDESHQFSLGGNRYMTGLSDGMIADFSPVYGTDSDKYNYLQLTKYDQDFKVLGYARVGEGWKDGSTESLEAENPVVVFEDGFYAMWRLYDKKDGTNTYIVGRYDNDMELKWERTLVVDDEIQALSGTAALEEGGLAIGGYRYDAETEDNITLCFILEDDGSVDDNLSYSDYLSSIRPYSIYPNPADEEVVIRFSPDVECEKIEIFGMDGKMYHEQNFKLETINVGNLSSGIYMMKVVLSGDHDYTERLIIK